MVQKWYLFLGSGSQSANDRLEGPNQRITSSSEAGPFLGASSCTWPWQVGTVLAV